MKPNVKSISIILLLAALCATGRVQAVEPESGQEARSGIVSAYTHFGFRLFAELAGKEPGKNVFISPASVSIALAMTYNGAAGKTRQAMAHTLGIEKLKPEEVNQANAALLRTYLESIPQVQLRIANSLWVNKTIHLKPAFTGKMQKAYSARIESLDFSNPQSAATINDWVKEATENKIPEIVSEVNPQTALFLINAIYFKGQWRSIFYPQDTKTAPFYLPGGKQKNVEMMAQKGRYKYFKDKDIQAISLPYGQGRLSMEILLPEKGADLAAFLKKITERQWDEWMGMYQMMEGDIRLPRFKMEFATSLNGPLEALGMAEAFSREKADFSNLLTPPPGAFISDVMHKAYVLVNEEGTDAAAATSVRIGLTSVAPTSERFKMDIDHPFFCAIRDNQTGAVLFMGLVVTPGE